ncbi:MAG: helix-turn-helix domain-containing protein [Kineosporiaceae bacterium]|jgi:transcriptional regulator with XRE-family HTH domain
MTVESLVEQVPAAVGRRVRAARAARGWTLDQLAEHSGVSRRMVVNVESGSSNASITTLLRLATALHVTLAELVSDTPRTDSVVVTAPGAREALWRGGSGGSAVMVAAADTPDMLELWDWTLGAGESYVSEAHRRGTRELIHVLSGQVRLTVAGQTHELRTDESASFPGDVAHGYANPGRRPARFSLTVFEPLPRVRP